MLRKGWLAIVKGRRCNRSSDRLRRLGRWEQSLNPNHWVDLQHIHFSVSSYEKGCLDVVTVLLTRAVPLASWD